MPYEIAIGRNEIFRSLSEANTAYEQFYNISDDPELYRKQLGHIDIQLTQRIEHACAGWVHVDLSDPYRGYKTAKHDRLIYPKFGICDIKQNIALFKCPLHINDSILCNLNQEKRENQLADASIVLSTVQSVHQALGRDEWRLYDAECNDFIVANQIPDRFKSWLDQHP